MGWRAWDNYEREAHERWKTLPWRARFPLPMLLTFALVAILISGFIFAAITRG